MSLVNKERIKQIRPRSAAASDPFPVSIPLGTDGLLVDMISQLDLQEEIRLGGNHYVTIEQNNVNTVIKEWYFSQSKQLRTIQEMDALGLITYSVQASIVNAVETKIGSIKDVDDLITWKNPRSESHPEGEDDRSYDQDDPTTFGDFLVIREQVDSSVTLIIIELFQGNFETKLHEKRIYIYQSSNGEIAVDEQIDTINSDNPFDDGGEPQPESEPQPEPSPENQGDNNTEPEVEG